MAENRKLPKSKFQGDLKLGGIYWKDAVHVRQSEGLNQWQKNHFRLMKMVEYQESVVQGALERLLTRIGIEYSRKEYVPTNDEILDKLMSIDPEVQKLVLLNGKAAAMEMFVKQNYDLQGRYRNIFQGGRVPRNMTMKVINDYLDEVDAPSMEPSALEDYTSQMRTGLAEVTQRHIAKSVAQMTAWNWSRGRGIAELTRRFQEEQKKEQIDMSKVLPNAETVVRTESMKILNAEAWRSATEVGSYADGLLWGFSYHAVGDSRTRQTHLAQHGVCAPVDDPFWNEWTPPNGYNCRCWLISEWEEPSSYKQPRRDLHPDPGFAFNPANNVAGRVPQPKKAEPKKPEVNAQSESNVKPDDLGKDDATSEKIFEKKAKNIHKPVTTPEKKRYNNMGVSKSTVKPNAPRSPEPLIPEVQNGSIIPTPDGKFLAVHGPMVKTTKTREAAEKAIRDAGGTVPEDNESFQSLFPASRLFEDIDLKSEKKSISQRNETIDETIYGKICNISGINDNKLKDKSFKVKKTNKPKIQRKKDVVDSIIVKPVYSKLSLKEKYRDYDFSTVPEGKDTFFSIIPDKKGFLNIDVNGVISNNSGKIQEEYDKKTKDEKNVIEYLLSIGYDISMIVENTEQQTSDFWIKGYKTELKTTISESEDTIYGYFRKARKQNCSILLMNMINANDPDLSKAIIWECIKRYKRNHNNNIDMDVELWTSKGKFFFEKEV